MARFGGRTIPPGVIINLPNRRRCDGKRSGGAMDTEVELLKDMVAALPDPVFVLTESGRYAAMAGVHDAGCYHDGSDLGGVNLYEVLPPEKADWFLEQIQRTLEEGGMRTVEYTLGANEVRGVNAPSGPSETTHFEGDIQPLGKHYKGERAVVWLARNVNRRHALESRLRHMSETDSLTGTFNRRKLMEELESRLAEFERYGQPCALITLDIDRFKSINDSYGHGVGDEVLRRITAICGRQLREPDILCRIGGEEFAVLAPGTDMTAAAQLGERLRYAIAQQAPGAASESEAVTVSVGVSAFVNGDADVEEVMRRADNGLYGAKNDGRNQVRVVTG